MSILSALRWVLSWCGSAFSDELQMQAIEATFLSLFRFSASCFLSRLMMRGRALSSSTPSSCGDSGCSCALSFLGLSVAELSSGAESKKESARSLVSSLFRMGKFLMAWRVPGAFPSRKSQKILIF